MGTLKLENYDMSAERGYLCRFNAEDVELSGELEQIRYVAMRLPQILPTGRVRDLLVQSLPDTNIKDALASCTDAQARRLMVHYSFMVQSQNAVTLMSISNVCVLTSTGGAITLRCPTA